MDFKPITFSEEFIQKYWEGPTNRFARYYMYLQGGFGLFNEAKNYLLMLFATYWTIKVMDWWVKIGYSDVALAVGLIIIAMIGIGFLILIGRWELYKLRKAREFASALFGSITQYQPFNMQVLQVALLIGIAEKLGVDIKKLEEGLNK